MSIEIKAWKCENCSIAYSTKESADNCSCSKKYNCKECGVEVPSYRTMCDACRIVSNFKKATKVELSDYELEMIVDPKTGEFHCIGSLIDYYTENENLEKPKWVYGCEITQFRVDIDGAIESAQEDMHDEFDDSHVDDIDEIKAFVEEWNKKQTGKTSWEDSSVAVMIPDSFWR